MFTFVRFKKECMRRNGSTSNMAPKLENCLRITNKISYVKMFHYSKKVCSVSDLAFVQSMQHEPSFLPIYCLYFKTFFSNSLIIH